jgi:hypothetical protein
MRKCNHTYKPTDTYYINKRPGRTPKKYTGRRDTSALNYYIQAKHKKTLFILLILKANMSLYM